MRTTRGIAAAMVLFATTFALSGSAGQAIPPPAATFHGLTPARLADTRTSGITIDGTAKGQGAIAAGQQLTVPVLGRGGVPAFGVGSVALNVTAINPTAASFLTVYPTGAARPNASNLNLSPGRTLPNMVIVPVGAAGQISIYNDRGASHVAVDVLGWFPPFVAFQGLTPARLADTRPNGQTVDGSGAGGGAIPAGSSRTVTVVDRGGVPDFGVGAVALNVTAINPTAASFLTVYPTGATRPNASNLNLAAGRTLPNMVIVPVGAAGQISVYNDRGDTNVAIDVLGWFPDGVSFTGLTPARLADTRPNGATVDSASQGTGVIGPQSTLDIPMLARGGVPASGVGAVALNVTAINPTAASFLTVYPAGATRPNASNLNLAPGRTLPNMVIVPLGTNGQISVYNDRGDTHLAIDVLGWFPSTAPTSPSTARVSLASNGDEADSFSTSPSISADGRYIAFDSHATNLVPNDTNDFFDVFVHDRHTNTTTRVSVTSTGQQATGGNSRRPSISADGRYIAFDSNATNLAPGDTNDSTDVFVHDRHTNTTTRVSVTTSGDEAEGSSFFASISADGRYVSFASDATNLVPGDTNDSTDVFVHDRHTNTTTRVSVTSTGQQATGGSSSRPAISAEGRYVAFHSSAANLVANDTNGLTDVFVHDRDTGQTTRVNHSTGGSNEAAGGSSLNSSISADGRYVTFHSSATNLVPGDTNGLMDVFVRDRHTDTTTRVNVTSGGDEATGGNSVNPSISADGRYIAFHSAATNLVPNDTNTSTDVFVHDRHTSTTTRVSLNTAGHQATGGSSDSPAMSADGRYVAFTSDATNLVPGDTNGATDVFVRDQGTS